MLRKIDRVKLYPVQEKCPTPISLHRHCENFDELYELHKKHPDKKLIITTGKYGEGYDVTLVCLNPDNNEV